MAAPLYSTDSSGKVAVINIATGKISRLNTVDVREQLSLPTPAIRLANEVETPTAPLAPTVDYSQVPLDRLRGYAQDAGIAFAGKSRKMIEDELNELNFIPKAEDDD